MIKKIEFSSDPIEAGTERDLIIWADGPSTVEIKCFVKRPPPPGFRPCKECGTFEDIANGTPFPVRASAERFAGGGTLVVTIIDKKGGHEELRIEVLAREDNARFVASAGA